MIHLYVRDPDVTTTIAVLGRYWPERVIFICSILLFFFVGIQALAFGIALWIWVSAFWYLDGPGTKLYRIGTSALLLGMVVVAAFSIIVLAIGTPEHFEKFLGWSIYLLTRAAQAVAHFETLGKPELAISTNAIYSFTLALAGVTLAYLVVYWREYIVQCEEVLPLCGTLYPKVGYIVLFHLMFSLLLIVDAIFDLMGLIFGERKSYDRDFIQPVLAYIWFVLGISDIASGYLLWCVSRRLDKPPDHA
jgi:hypothetical protein